MTTTEVEWGDYGALLEAEGAAYNAMLETRSPTSGRVYPTKVAAATNDWHAAIETRMKESKRLAAELGCKPFEVTVLYYRHRVAEAAKTKGAKKK